MNLPELRTLAIELLDGGIAVLRVNRPDRMNAQTVTMFAEYGIAARALRDSGLRALILTGAGDRAFCAGFDLDELDAITRFGVRDFLKFQETAAGGITAIRHLPFPVIAAVHGAAVGGGLALALAADIRLASPTAKFSAAFVRVGLSMGELGVVLHPQPPGRPRQGGRDRLHRARRRRGGGRRDRPGQPRRARRAPVRRGRSRWPRLIAANSPGGVRLSKRAIQRNQEITSYAAALELENRGQALLTRTEDMPEALAAFKQRAPRSREVSRHLRWD